MSNVVDTLGAHWCLRRRRVAVLASALLLAVSLLVPGFAQPAEQESTLHGTWSATRAERDRPVAFEAKQGSGHILVRFARAKP
jgi:hypothetical protein